MIDPLADPLAADLLAAAPEDVAALAARFRAAADGADMTGAGLTAAEHDATWRGAAADRFRGSIRPLPGRLADVQAGYAEVARALNVYEPELARIRSGFLRVIGARGDNPDPAEATRLSRQAQVLLDEFAAARDACRAAVAAAQVTAPVRP